MLTFSLENDYRAGQVKSRYSGKSEKQYPASNLGKVCRSIILGRTLPNVDAAGDRSAKRHDHCDQAENKTQYAGEHVEISPLAQIMITEHAALLKVVEMSLLGATVFCICFAVTAGL